MKKYLIHAISVMALAVMSVSCSDLTEMNINPTKANGSLDPDLLIPTIQASHSLGRENASRFMIYPGGWTNHWTGVWSVVEYGGKGKPNNQYNYRLWQTLMYPEAVKNLVALENIVADDPDMVNYRAIAKVLRVEVFLKLTDYYGDVPYFEGGQGYYGQIYAPKYDTQEDIYNDFFKILGEAIDEFDPAKPSPASDFYFGGDVAKWQRFAASLKLRVAMRLIKVAPEKAEQMAREAYESGVMTSNEDIASVRHDEDYQTLGAGNGYADIMLQITSSPDLGLTQFKMSTEFFKALSVQDPDTYDVVPYHRLLATDPRLLLIARTYFVPSNSGLTAWDVATDVTEIVRKFNAENSAAQTKDLVNNVDGYVNTGGYLTVPAQEFIYGGGVQRKGESGYQGEEKERSVWGPAITTKTIDDALDSWAAEWLAEDKAELKNLKALVSQKSNGMLHNMQRLGPSKTILAVNSPYIHMSYAETQFLLAETSIRGWGFDKDMSAVERFRQGYIAAVKQFSLWGVSDNDMPTDAEITEYLDKYLVPEVEKGGDAALEEINKQIWILHFMDPFEAWANIRRTDGMPTAYTKFYNRYPTENQFDGGCPKRITYPVDEQTKNAANWQEAVDRMGGQDLWTVPVWWDVQ